jgi:hypothetical protein
LRRSIQLHRTMTSYGGFRPGVRRRSGAGAIDEAGMVGRCVLLNFLIENIQRSLQ